MPKYRDTPWGIWTHTYCIDFEEEHDFECDWKIIDRERLSPAEHTLRWIESIKEWDEDTRAQGAAPILRDLT